MNSIRNWDHTKKHVSSELDTDQGEGITRKFKVVAEELNDEFSELPSTLEHDQTLLNQSDEFPAPPQATT